MTIDRIDTDADYSPSNCRWATKAEQANNKTNTIVIEWNGEAHTISKWAEITGISRSTLNNRHWRGWDAERMLTAPVTHGNQYTFYKAEREAERMSRYIDADAVIARIAGQMSYEIEVETGNEIDCVDLAEELLNDIPSIDIVFCKECKRRKKNGFCLEHNRYEKNDNGYCSYGEREGE